MLSTNEILNNNPMIQVLQAFQFETRGYSGPERVNNFPKVTQPDQSLWPKAHLQGPTFQQLCTTCMALGELPNFSRVQLSLL